MSYFTPFAQRCVVRAQERYTRADDALFAADYDSAKHHLCAALALLDEAAQEVTDEMFRRDGNETHAWPYWDFIHACITLIKEDLKVYELAPCQSV